MKSIIYLLQVSACTGIFYIFYLLMLSRLTFFTINRWYLMVTLVLSFVIPLLTIPINGQFTPIIQQVLYVNRLQVLPAQQQVADLHQPAATITWVGLLKGIYWAGAAGLLIKLAISFVALRINVRNSKITRIGNVNLISGNKKVSNGSFFNHIFLNDDELNTGEVQQIIAHEMLHVKLYHSVDRLVLKIMQIVLWFNPFIHLYARVVEQNHEFEVDGEITQSTDKGKYADMLLDLSVTRQGILYHSFSKAPLKMRISMLFTKPTNHMKRMIYVFALPIVLVSCLAFANVKTDAANASHTNTIAVNTTDVASDFYTRIHIIKDGKSSDKIIFRLARESGSANLAAGDQVGTFIDGVFYNEDEIKKLSAEKVALLSFDNEGFKADKIPEGNYAVPFSFKTKKATAQ
nr:M56 family metallopeptidase [Mucilaginibacter sp. L294]